jgi:hypothetical protein
MRRPRNLQRPIEIEYNGERIKLGTIGFICAALGGKSRASALQLIRSGVLPPAPFEMAPESVSAKRRLFLLSYVDDLKGIAQRLDLPPRLDASSRQRLRQAAWAAHEKAMEPLLRVTATASVDDQ